MGLTLDCFSPTGLSLDDVRAVLARAAGGFAGFFGFSASSAQVLICHPARLPELAGLPGVGGYGDITLMGHLAPAGAYADFTAILGRGEAAVAELGWLAMEVVFQPIPRGTGERGRDRLGVARRAGRSYFTYAAEASPAAYDLRSRKEMLAGVIRAARLPLRLALWEGTVNLYHREERQLWLSDATGYNQEFPGAFSCELPDAPDALLRRLQEAETALAQPGTRDSRWIATTRVPGRRVGPIRSLELLQAVRDAALPAAGYTCTVSAAVTDLIGLDALRGCLGPGDRVTHCLGQLTLGPDNHAILDALATADGFQLRLSPQWPTDKVELTRRLGVVMG